MRNWFLAFAFAVPVALVGCLDGEVQGDDDATDDDTSLQDDDTSSDDDDSAEASVEIKSTYPEDGATDFYHRNDLIVEFTGVVEGVEIVLVEQGVGAVVPGELVSNDVLPLQGGSKWTVATFDPFGDGPDTCLDLSTSYTATVEWPDHEPYSFTFQTSEVGMPLDDPEAVVGNDYAWSLSSARFSHPI